MKRLYFDVMKRGQFARVLHKRYAVTYVELGSRWGVIPQTVHSWVGDYEACKLEFARLSRLGGEPYKKLSKKAGFVLNHMCWREGDGDIEKGFAKFKTNTFKELLRVPNVGRTTVLEFVAAGWIHKPEPSWGPVCPTCKRKV